MGLIFFGKIVKPPYRVTQEQGKAYVNGIEVYPLQPGLTAVEPRASPYGPGGEEPPGMDFELDDVTKKALDEGLSLVGSIEGFEEKAEKLTEYLKGKGIRAYREENYGDVMIDTGEGWGIVGLFNEDARIKLAREAEALVAASERRIPFDDATLFSDSVRTSLDRGDLVVLDSGIMTVMPSDEARRTLSTLRDIAKSDEPPEKKIEGIISILSIPRESAKKLMEELTQ